MSSENKAKAITLPPCMDPLTLHSYQHPECSQGDSVGRHTYCSEPGLPWVNWMPRPRLLKNLSICPPAWEPHESLKGCAWLRHHQGGRKRVSWPCCVTWTLSSGSCRGVACLLCGSHGSTYRVSPCACVHSTVREGPGWGPSLLVCGRLPWF